MLSDVIDKVAQLGDEDYWILYVRSSATDVLQTLNRIEMLDKANIDLEDANREKLVENLADLIIGMDALSVSCGLDDSIAKEIDNRLKSFERYKR